MNKREFLKTVGVGALALGGDALGVGRASGAQGKKRTRAKVKNWVWITPDLEKPLDAWKRDLALMKASGIDAIIPEVYDGRQAYYQSRWFPVKAELLESLLPLAASTGLEVHAWMWTMPCLLEGVMKKHPDWYSVNRKGDSAVDKPAYVDYYRFLDPARPEVREFVRETVRELAAIAEIKGIHLDYIRHPDAILPSGLWAKYGIVQDKVYPEYDYGYSDYSRRAFKVRHGIDPTELSDPEGNRAWMQYRLDSVTDLVNDYLVPAAHEKGKTITAAVFPGPSLARTMVRQDWGRWRLDAFLPMLYHTFYEAGPEWVRTYTEEAVATVKKPVYSGLFVPPLGEAELARTVQMAFDGGADGISIFEAAAMDEAKWKTVAALLTPR